MTIASAFNDIAVEQGGTASTSGTIAGAIDALNDALAGSDQECAQTIEHAVILLGEHISGGCAPLLGGKVKIVNYGDQMPVANESYAYEGISPVGKLSIGDTVVADTHFVSGGAFSEVAAGVTIEIQDNILEDSVGFYIVSIDNEDLVTSVEDATVVYSVEDAHLSFTVPEVPVGKCLFVRYGLEG